MKNILLTALLSLGLVACSGGTTEEATEAVENNQVETTEAADGEKDLVKIKVGATPVPHAELLELVKEDLASEGIELEIVEFNDYLTPNLALNDGSIDANFFQHEPYFVDNIETNNLDLISLGKVHLEPLALYSDKYKSLDELPEGAEIFIPNDPTNGARALLLLDSNGLIKLKDPSDINATERDIAENSKNLKFTALEAAAIPSSYKDADGAIINSNFALKADLSPTEDGIIIEDKNSPYANLIAIRKEDENREELQTLLKVLQSDKVKKYIEETYKGEILPAF